MNLAKIRGLTSALESLRHTSPFVANHPTYRGGSSEVTFRTVTGLSQEQANAMASALNRVTANVRQEMEIELRFELSKCARVGLTDEAEQSGGAA